MIAGAGAAGPAGPSGGAGSAPPDNVSAIIVSGGVSGMSTLQPEDYSSPDAQGNVYALVAVTYTPPSPLGTFTGTHGYDELPDGSGSTPRASLGAMVLGTDGLNAPAAPGDLGRFPYDPVNIPSIQLRILPALVPQRCRIYLASFSPDIDNDLILNTGGGPTPSGTIIIGPPDARAVTGMEFAPLARNLTLVDGYPKYRLITGGTQQYQYALQWDDPVDDQRYGALAGYTVALDEPLVGINGVYDPGNSRTDTYQQDEISRINDGQPAYPGQQPWISPWHDVPNGAAELVTAWFDSFAGDGGTPNSIVPGVTPSVQFTIAPQSPGTDQLYAPDVTAFTCVSRWGLNTAGHRSLFFDCGGTEPTGDNRYVGVELHLFNPTYAPPLFPEGIVLTGKGENLPSSPGITTGWPTVTEVWRMVALSTDPDGNVNPYLADISPQSNFDVIPYTDDTSGVSLQNVTAFSVTAVYTEFDRNGKQALLLTPLFTRPTIADDPTWNSIALWANIPSYSWVNLSFPSTGGAVDQVAWEDIPKTTADWDFLAISLDVDGKDNTGNPAPNPLSAPPGTPSFTLSIAPPVLGVAGAEYCDNVNSFSIALGAAITTPDGTSIRPVTATFSPTGDTRWRSVDLITHFSDGVTPNKTEQTMVRKSPFVFAWKEPGSSQTVRWYALSHDVYDNANTLEDTAPGGGVATPHFDVTAGSTNQLDLTAAAVDKLSSQFKIDPILDIFAIAQIAADLIIAGQLQVGGGTLNGTVNMSGTTVTWVSGDHFSATTMKDGYPITINGFNFLIGHVSSTTVLTITGGSGSLTAVTYSFGRPPQLKVFDRLNQLLVFLGDDSSNTGYVGSYLAQMVRLGGPDITHPVIDIDNAGVTTWNLTKNNALATIDNASDTSSGGFPAGFKILDLINLIYTAITTQGVQGSVFFSGVYTGIFSLLGFSGGGGGHYGRLRVGSVDGSTSTEVDGRGFIRVNGTQVLSTRGVGLTSPVGPVSGAAGGAYTSTEQTIINALIVLADNLRTRVIELETQLGSGSGHGLFN